MDLHYLLIETLKLWNLETMLIIFLFSHPKCRTRWSATWSVEPPAATCTRSSASWKGATSRRRRVGLLLRRRRRRGTSDVSAVTMTTTTIRRVAPDKSRVPMLRLEEGLTVITTHNLFLFLFWTQNIFYLSLMYYPCMLENKSSKKDHYFNQSDWIHC